MLTESQKRAAALAVHRYGVDRVRVRETAAALQQSQTAGQAEDLLHALVREGLLGPAQAKELMHALEQTQIDPRLTPPEPSPAEPGQPVPELRRLNSYQILRRLGEGGMGAVFLAYEKGQRRQVAIKVLPDALAANEAYVERFYREAKSASQLDHPNIVRFVDVGRDSASGKHFLVLEYVDGPSAHALLDRYGRLAVGDAVHIVLDIAHALEHAQSRNIVHRDIKPDNILLTQSGVAKLADLGLAKRVDEDSHLTGARQGFGTPFYMPYEQAINAKQADGRSDIFALGATLYHLLTGTVPFPGQSPLEIAEKKSSGTFVPVRALDADVPESLERILTKMLARNPDDRYQTASELIVDLERSGLAALVPSFVDPELALQDPLVRARLTTPAQPTQLDLNGSHKSPSADVNPDVWYVRYRNPEGRWCKTRASTAEVHSRLRAGRLPPTSEAGHLPQEGFRPLHTYPEFRASVAAAQQTQQVIPNGITPRPPPPKPTATPRLKSQVLWLVPLAMLLLSAVVAMAYFYFVQ
jgi:serine/threonine-protein kinase